MYDYDVVYCGPASLRFVGEMPLLYIKGSPVNGAINTVL
jgi:hypothetical protein